MPTELFLAPAGYGKTEYVLEEVRAAARGLQDTPRVVLPTSLQVDAWRRRLADSGGALGIRLYTFDRLYAELLNSAGINYTRLEDPVEYRLMRTVVDEVPLPHYGALGNRPGFIQVVRDFIYELKSARIWPEDYLAAVGDEPRLRELGLIYHHYQQRLQENRWVDGPGLGWLAAESLAKERATAGRAWSLLVVDGFDSFTENQLALLALLDTRVERMVITLTGNAGAEGTPRAAHYRFVETRQRLEQRLGTRAQPLPQARPPAQPALARLEATLFERRPRSDDRQEQAPDGERGDRRQAEEKEEGRTPVTLLAAPDRAGEVRAALRWLKQRHALDGTHPADLALLARNLAPYRATILETAAEFGLPIRLVDGLPLRQNPAIAALLELLRLLLPAPESGEGPALPRRGVIAAWRTPYLDWERAYPDPDQPEPIGIEPGDAESLAAVARWGRVIGGYEQWREALNALAARAREESHRAYAEGDQADNLPSGEEALALRQKFARFLQRLLLLHGPAPYRVHVARLEALIGPDPREERAAGEDGGARTHLNLVGRVDEADGPTAGRDRAALQKLKGILRGLVWAEEVVGDGASISFARFFQELSGAIEAATYRPPRPAHGGILVTDVGNARGIPFADVAVLGLAEGEFPAALREDPFLRDADRRRLRERHGLALAPSTDSRERETFYETISRPWSQLLLTRPRLADSGAPWQASPFWEEVDRRVDVAEEQISSERVPQPEAAASWPEMMAALVAHAAGLEARKWVTDRQADRWRRLIQAATIFGHRYQRRPSPYDGDLTAAAPHLGRRYGPDYTWSPSRLESYRTCPLFFFVGRVLELEARTAPAEGLDARQLGNLYHQILEEVYRAVPAAERTDAAALTAILPTVANPILDAAPQEEGFRATAWWEQTRAEIMENVRRSLEALCALGDAFIPVGFEAGFFGEGALTVQAGGDSFRLHGLIDRVDRTGDGRIRIVDYKTAGPYKFTSASLHKGEKLQLPLYALAAEEALGLGEVADGFYWHVRHAQASPLQLAEFGIAEAIEVATEFSWGIVLSVRRGDFQPAAPAGGCPDYCPAAAFCWQYEARGSWQ